MMQYVIRDSESENKIEEIDKCRQDKREASFQKEDQQRKYRVDRIIRKDGKWERDV